jgi:hypothetical protein
MSFDVATAPQPAELLIRMDSCHDWAKVVKQDFAPCLQGVPVMRPIRAITTLASVTAIACSIFAFSWIGLALLGF